MGLRNLDLAEWIAIDSQYADLMARRQALLAERYAAVFQQLPGSETAATELLALLADHLPRRFPDGFQRQGTRLVNRLTGQEWDLADPARPPLEIAGLLVPEDLCLLADPAVEALPRLLAAVLCFPNRWRLADKIGRPLAAVHGPVAQYAEKLERPVDRFIAMLSADKPVWRINWALNDDPALFQPLETAHTAPRPEITADNAGTMLWLRIERQTLRRLPTSGAVLFTIRTYQQRLDELTGTQAANLAAILRTAPESVARYKGLHRTAPPALVFLDRHAKAHQGGNAAST